MLLSNEDMNRIISKIKKPKNFFSYQKEGYLYLKNKERHCIFLDPAERHCTIYDFRPKGCRFYPIIYNPFRRTCVVDKECTNKLSIQTNLVEIPCPSLQEFILLLEQERKERLKLIK
jgi:Fe-S-cluster containining protein